MVISGYVLPGLRARYSGSTCRKKIFSVRMSEGECRVGVAAAYPQISVGGLGDHVAGMVISGYELPGLRARYSGSTCERDFWRCGRVSMRRQL